MRSSDEARSSGIHSPHSSERMIPAARPGRREAASVFVGVSRLPAEEANHAQKRRLLARLRDAHAAAVAQVDVLRWCSPDVAVASPALRCLLVRLFAEAEEQLHRLDHAFASLRENPGGGDPRTAADITAVVNALRDGAASRPGLESDAALASALLQSEQNGAEQAAALRLLAHATGLHLMARLLDLTEQERRAAAHALARFAVEPGRSSEDLAHRPPDGTTDGRRAAHGSSSPKQRRKRLDADAARGPGE